MAKNSKRSRRQQSRRNKQSSSNELVPVHKLMVTRTDPPIVNPRPSWQRRLHVNFTLTGRDQVYRIVGSDIINDTFSTANFVLVLIKRVVLYSGASAATTSTPPTVSVYPKYPGALSSVNIRYNDTAALPNERAVVGYRATHNFAGPFSKEQVICTYECSHTPMAAIIDCVFM